MSQLVAKLTLGVLLLLHSTNGARILGVFPHPSYSHQVIFRAITMELLKRGHEMFVFTTAPVNDPTIKNYTEVDLSFLNDAYIRGMRYKTIKDSIWTFLDMVQNGAIIVTDETLSHPTMQRLISPNSTEKFDLILMQCILNHGLYSLSIRFNAPMIGLSSLPLLSVQNHMLGNPPMLESIPNVFLEYTDEMNLWQRMVNVYFHFRQVYDYTTIAAPAQDEIVKKHFGDSMPPTTELSKNIDMLFVYSHPFLHYPRPNLPSIIEIGGCRLGQPKKDLPKDLKKLLDNTGPGFIYFSLGSNIKSSDLPTEMRGVLLETFAELPYTIVWKFESDEFTNTPRNVIVKKWLPQQEILAHPKILLFMYQGGLQSTEEAIDNGVPLIGFPVFSDQNYNLGILERRGVAKRLDITKLTKETLKGTILEIARNSSYKENMLKLRELLLDTPRHPMENAIWWVEHVIRHKGVPYLYNKGRNMPWYTNGVLDIITIFLITLLVLSYVMFIILRLIVKRIARLTQRSHPKNASPLKKKE